MTDLVERVGRLEAIAAIQALKARYTAFADAKYNADRSLRPAALLAAAAQGQAACFTEDAVWEADDRFGGDMHGRDRLAEWFATPPWRFALHLYAAPEFTFFDRDRASARWRLWQIAARPSEPDALLLVAVTEEHYRRQSTGGWLIERMRFNQLHTLPLPGTALAVFVGASIP